jgi:hypothetical protein
MADILLSSNFLEAVPDAIVAVARRYHYSNQFAD